MKFIADLHIHSEFSRATSKECNIPILYKYAKMKGVNVLATGDFTHPKWFKHIEEHLTEDGRGLLDLKEEIKKKIDEEIPQFKDKLVKFIFSVEISSIYKKKGRVRKIHNVILLPDFQSVKKLNEKLGSLGNIRSDGRPILGLDSRNLLEMVLEINPDSIFIPAHIWTPWFSLFGMNSGFDRIEDCFEDLTKEIFALETGLSSDPAMNWRLSALDRFNLVSNSDAHSPANLAREANLFNTELDYFKMRDALRDKKSKEFIGTIEFFPEEGKYHYDGHRLHNVRLSPQEAIARKLLCPVCGKPITVGVAHRVEKLADRKEGERPALVKEFTSMIPLAEIIADAFGAGKTTNKVMNYYNKLIYNLGPELFILREASIDDVKKHSTEIIAEGVRRVRENKVKILPGYDGEYGKIIIFSEEDRVRNVSQSLLISLTPDKPKSEKKEVAEEQAIKPLKEEAQGSEELLPSSLPENKEQEEAIARNEGPVIVMAGPGTGKTWTLISKIVSLIHDHAFKPESILAITFTNKAVREIIERLKEKEIKGVHASTFHSLALEILQENDFNKVIFDEYDSLLLLKEILRDLNVKRNARDTLNSIMRTKATGAQPADTESRNIMEIYQARLDYYNGMDYEDIIIYCHKLLNKFPALQNRYRSRFQYILVDEFQDVNESEYQLIKMLSDKGKNLAVIGDPDQSIYAFRGSSSRFLFQLKEDFPGAQVIILRNNYRNPANFMKAGIDVIKHSSQVIRRYEDIRMLVRSASRIEMIRASTELSALIQMAKVITGLIGGSSMDQADILDQTKTYTFRDFAILVRNSSQIPMIEEVLVKEGIPYKLMGDRSIFDEKAVRVLLDILRLGLGPFNNFRFFQIIQTEYFDVPAATLHRLREKLASQPEADLRKEANGLAEIHKNYKLLKIIMDEGIKGNERPDLFFKQFPFTFLEEDKLQPFLIVARQFSSVKSLLLHFLLGEDQDFEVHKDDHRTVKNIEKISILTIHSAKGLEFPVVFLFEPVEGVLPFLEKEALLDEEMRLFYVALTRARERLFFIVPDKRKHYGQVMATEVSRFIKNISQDLIDERVVKISEKRYKEKSQLTFW